MEKYSKQKEEIFNFIKSAKSHPTAEEIYLGLNETNNNISRGTVYRNLNLLVEKGIIKRISISNFSDRFEYIIEPHNHAICTMCGRVFDFNYKIDNSKLKKSILNETELESFSNEFTVYGICKDCNLKIGGN